MENDSSFDIESAYQKLSSDLVEASSNQEVLTLDEQQQESLVSAMEDEANNGRFSSRLLEMATMLADTEIEDNPFNNERLSSAFLRQREYTREMESRYSELSPYGEPEELNLVEYLPSRQREHSITPEVTDSFSPAGESEPDEDPGNLSASSPMEPSEQDAGPRQGPQPIALDQSVTFTPVEEEERQDSGVDLTAIPAPVRERFREGQDGKFFFKDGKDADSVAFRDQKTRLTTNRDDTLVAHSLVDVAESRDWHNIRAQGTKEFRREVWLEATARGLEVEGYKVNQRDLEDLEHRKQDLERRSNSLEATPEPGRSLAGRAEGGEEGREGVAMGEASSEEEKPSEAPVDRLEGKLLRHGKAPYQNDERNKESYFVELENADGQRHTQWGVDLERALNESDTGEGDMVRLEDKGKNPVKVRAPEFDKQGKFKGTKEIETYRRTWSVHAKAIREHSPEQLAERHPELANEAAWMKAADLKIGQQLDQGDREDFNNRVRERMAERAEQGERAPDLQVTRPVEREPQQPEQTRSPDEPSR